MGGGPAGLAAAAEAARRGAEVLLVEEQRVPGGGLAVLGDVLVDGGTGPVRSADMRKSLEQEAEEAGVTILTQTVAWGTFEERAVGVLTPVENLEVRPAALILAPGSTDRPLPFPGWALPTVMNAQEVLRLVYLQGIRPGRRAVVASAGGAGVPVALALQGAGIAVETVVEASWLDPEEHARLAAFGIQVIESARVGSAQGQEYVKAVLVNTEQGEQMRRADLLVLATGRAPQNELCWIAGCEMRWEAGAGGHVPVRSVALETSMPGIYVAGDGGGVCGLRTALAEGRVAGAAAAARCMGAADPEAALLDALARAVAADAARVSREMDALWSLEASAVQCALVHPEIILCRCEHVTATDVQRVVREGALSPGEVKRHTRAGMGECQGRTCRLLLARAIAQINGVHPHEIPTLTCRPPVRPLPLDALLRGPE